MRKIYFNMKDDGLSLSESEEFKLWKDPLFYFQYVMPEMSVIK